MREFIIQCNGNEERGGEGECTIKRERERERDGGGREGKRRRMYFVN